MNSKTYLGRISTFLARFTTEVRQFNEASQYDINIHSENVLIPLLKVIFGYEGLQNANVKEKNAPAIDLLDFESRVCIQVTATADAQKITDTLKKFNDNDLYKAFDRIIIYIITERQDNYRKDFKSLLPADFDFDTNRDIIDNAGLYKFISSQILNTRKLAQIEQLLADEFSELKIEQRQVTVQYDTRIETKSDRIFLNMVSLSVPETLYIADLSFDFDTNRKELVAEIKEQKKLWKLRHLTQKDDIKYFFRKVTAPFFLDYILYNNKVLTFRDLHEQKEPLRKIIDIGTITPVTHNEFINDDLDKEVVFKSLLASTLRHDLAQRDIEWFHPEKVFRFKMTGIILKGKKVKWKSEAGKGVIFEVLSKEDKTTIVDDEGKERIKKGKHIVCFRHLAFSVSFQFFEGAWFMAIKPDWSFTSASNGYSTSRYSADYATGIKKLEKNGAILQNFQFLAGYLSLIAKGDMLTPKFTLQFSEISLHLEARPSIPDDLWSQSEPKSKKDKNQLDFDFNE